MLRLAGGLGLGGFTHFSFINLFHADAHFIAHPNDALRFFIRIFVNIAIVFTA